MLFQPAFNNSCLPGHGRQHGTAACGYYRVTYFCATEGKLTSEKCQSSQDGQIIKTSLQMFSNDEGCFDRGGEFLICPR